MSVPLRLLKTEPPLTSRLAIETRIVPSVSPILSRLIRVSGRMRGPIRASFARAAARPASSARPSKSSCGASMVASIFVRPSRLRTVALARIAERPTEEPRLGDMIELLEACSPRTHGHCHRARVERCRHRALCASSAAAPRTCPRWRRGAQDRREIGGTAEALAGECGLRFVKSGELKVRAAALAVCQPFGDAPGQRTCRRGHGRPVGQDH